MNGDNLNHVRHETTRHLRTKKDEYLKDQIYDLAANSKSNNIRDIYRRINKFMRAYQPRSNIVKAENGDLLADSKHFK
jgi:hypothetical protein